jgi:hypothetical protein
MSEFGLVYHYEKLCSKSLPYEGIYRVKFKLVALLHRVLTSKLIAVANRRHVRVRVRFNHPMSSTGQIGFVFKVWLRMGMRSGKYAFETQNQACRTPCDLPADSR